MQPTSPLVIDTLLGWIDLVILLPFAIGIVIGATFVNTYETLTGGYSLAQREQVDLGDETMKELQTSPVYLGAIGLFIASGKYPGFISPLGGNMVLLNYALGGALGAITGALAVSFRTTARQRLCRW